MGEGKDHIRERTFGAVRAIWFYANGYAFRAHGDGIIEVDVENPYDPGTEWLSWAKYSLYVHGSTVDSYFASGGMVEDLKADVTKGLVALVGDAVGAARIPEHKFKDFYDRWVRAGCSDEVYPPPSAWTDPVA